MLPSEIEERLLERDLAMLVKYAERHMLPSRRVELQLAKVTQHVHADRRLTLAHYLVDPRCAVPEAANEDENAEEVGGMLAAVGGGNVIKLGQGRKRKAA